MELDLLNPKGDGVEHINVYTKGKTPLGRKLSNLAPISLEHPDHGHFDTAEGLWYYLSTGRVCDQLRTMSGYDARITGRTLIRVSYEDFQSDFCKGLRAKVLGNEELAHLMAESTLPFVHYYWYGKSEDAVKVIKPINQEWIMTYLELMRYHLQHPRSEAS